MRLPTELSLIAVILTLALGNQVPASGNVETPAKPKAAGGEEIVGPTGEHFYGQRSRALFMQRVARTRDAALAERVEEIGRRVAAYSDRPGLSWGFAVLVPSAKDRQLQAISLAGGTIGITEPAARLLTEDELAFALGHEVAHVALRHHLGPEGDAPPSPFQESEADRYGALYAVRAGYAFSAGVDSLRRMKVAGARTKKLTAFRPELEWALRAFDAGVAALDAGDAEEARVALGGFVHTFPHSLAGRINLGTACLARLSEKQGNPSALEQPWPVLRGHGIRLRGARDSALLDVADQHFRQALALEPESTQAFVGLSIVALYRGDGEKALGLLNRVQMPVDPDRRAEWLLARGNAEYALGRWDSAVTRYKRALQARPGWPAARSNLAETYEASGQAELALPILEELREGR
jgi:predicted Zn-dependent protease